MKSTSLSTLLLFIAVTVTSIAAFAEIANTPVSIPASMSVYPEIPAMPQYIYMDMSAYTAPL